MQYQKICPQKKCHGAFLLAGLLSLLALTESHAQLGRAVRQVIVTQAATWNSHTASLQCWQRSAADQPWQPVLWRAVCAQVRARLVDELLRLCPFDARDIVLMNAGAAIYVAGIASSLQAGIEKAAEVIDNGAALEKLNQLIERSNRA